MCALTPQMFPNKQQEWYDSASTMDYNPCLQYSQVDSFAPTLQYDLPFFLYPNNLLAQPDDSKSYNNINLHQQLSLSHSNGTNSNTNNNDQEELRGTVSEKKLNHNASERDRRRKLNGLYSSLRDLLPPSDQKRKLSIPMTVARVVKYIPEQKQEIQRLSRKKEELLKRISRKTATLNHHHQEQLRNRTMDSSMSANWITDTEIAVQIATSKWTSISDMLLRLEENGLNVINVSSSVSSTARIFYTLHLQMSEYSKVRLEELNDLIFGLRQSY